MSGTQLGLESGLGYSAVGSGCHPPSGAPRSHFLLAWCRSPEFHFLAPLPQLDPAYTHPIACGSYANAPSSGHRSVGTGPVPQRAQRHRGWAGRHPGGSGGHSSFSQASPRQGSRLGLLRTPLPAARAVALDLLKALGVCQAKSPRRPRVSHRLPYSFTKHVSTPYPESPQAPGS